MRPISILAIPIYQKLSEQYSNPTKRIKATKQYILNEVTQWSIKSLDQDGNYFFKPKEFSGDNKSLPFEVRLIKGGPYPGMYELKFGNLNADNDKDRYYWDDKDPYRLQKALFLRNVLELKIASMLQKGKIDAIVFSPYDEDGLGEERYSYFYNMYSKLGKDKFDLQLIDDSTYVITKKYD
jgi:hypothetical protein